MLIDKFSGYYDFLSNKFPCIVELDGVQYTNVVAAYYSAKTTSSDVKRKLQRLDPDRAELLGKSLPEPDNWKDIRDDVMYKCLLSKFTLNLDLRAKLKGLSNVTIVYANDCDTYWGVVNCKGENMLGKLLNRVCIEILTGVV